MNLNEIEAKLAKSPSIWMNGQSAGQEDNAAFTSL